MGEIPQTNKTEGGLIGQMFKVYSLLSGNQTNGGCKAFNFCVAKPIYNLEITAEYPIFDTYPREDHG